MPINPDPATAIAEAARAMAAEVVRWWRSLSPAEQSTYLESIEPPDGIEITNPTPEQAEALRSTRNRLTGLLEFLDSVEREAINE